MSNFNKKFYILFSLTINASIFLAVYSGKDLSSLNTLFSIWSWSIWAYVLYQLNMLISYARNKLNKIESLFICLDYIFLLCFFLLYTFIYAYKIYDMESLNLLILYFIMLFELTTSYYLKNTKFLYSSNEDKLCEDEIREYIYKRITREDVSHISLEKKKRIIITILNVITILFLCFIPILGQIIYELFHDFIIVAYFLIIISICFFALNRVKYKKCNISFIRFIIDMSTSILGIFYYSYLYQYYNFGMFIKLFVSIYLLTPMIISSEKILRLYQIGNSKVYNTKGEL